MLTILTGIVFSFVVWNLTGVTWVGGVCIFQLGLLTGYGFISYLLGDKDIIVLRKDGRKV